MTLGSEAASPQIDTGVPVASPARTVAAIASQTTGSAARAGVRAGSRRSSPSRAALRSLLPMDRKSASAARSSMIAIA